MGSHRRAILIAMVVVLLLVGVWESLEHTWLADIELRLIHTLHLLRGVLCAVIVAGLVVSLITRTRPTPRIASVRDDAGWWRPTRLTEEQWAANYGRWFIRMRWLVVPLVVTAAFAATHVTGLLAVSQFWPLTGIAGVLAIVNLFYMLLIRRPEWAQRLLPLQVYIDLIILTILLHFSGGVDNLLFWLMAFHVIIAGIISSRRQCFLVAVTASLLFGLLAWSEWAGWLQHYPLLLVPHLRTAEGVIKPARDATYVIGCVTVLSVVLLLAAHFVSTLAVRVRYEEQQATAMADRALAERRLLERALETTGTGLRVLDGQLQPYWMNDLWRQWFPSDSAADAAHAPAEQTLHDGEVRISEMVPSREERLAEPAAKQRVIQLTTAPLLDNRDKVVQIVELAQDVTQQREIQNQMLRAGQLAAVGELAGQIAHEVNNPIAILSAKARLLRRDFRGQVPERLIQELEKITHCADRVAHIAQGLLTYCRPSTQARAPLDLRSAISPAVELIEQKAASLNVAVHEAIPPDLPWVMGNANEMEQVFCNLFMNALDAMPNGGQLAIAAKHAGDTIIVTVQDTGVGIPNELRERIFEPFFTTKQEGRGTGLGLAICTGLMRSHGGSLRVSSEKDCGSCFTLIFPVARLQPQEHVNG